MGRKEYCFTCSKELKPGIGIKIEWCLARGNYRNFVGRYCSWTCLSETTSLLANFLEKNPCSNTGVVLSEKGQK